MKIIFLLPPSEGKNPENKYDSESLTFSLEKPLSICENVTEKDLKCTGKRFEEGISLNKNISNSETTEAIERYSGVMYNAIDYSGINDNGKKYFEENYFILSGMYGLLTPKDKIGNYKLPIESKGLYDFWGDKIEYELIKLKPDYIVNLLPISYAKMIGLGAGAKQKLKFDKLTNSGIKVVNINFLKSDGKKISHGVKKIKGEWVKNICENCVVSVESFGGEIIKNGNILDVNIVGTK